MSEPFVPLVFFTPNVQITPVHLQIQCRDSAFHDTVFEERLFQFELPNFEENANSALL